MTNRPIIDRTTARELLDDIAGRLNGREWTADTCSDIADLLRDAGYTVDDLPTSPEYARLAPCDPRD
jgi:hypothetical protein